jgi:prevent-host-death family protein
MKVVSITDIRQDATALLKHARQSGEPVLVIQRSRPAAYLVDAEQFDALQLELKELRRARLLREVDEAEREIDGGEALSFDSVDDLIATWSAPARGARRKNQSSSR